MIIHFSKQISSGYPVNNLFGYLRILDLFDVSAHSLRFGLEESVMSLR